MFDIKHLEDVRRIVYSITSFLRRVLNCLMRDKWPFSREKVGELPRDTCVGRLVLSRQHDGSSQHSCRRNVGRDVLPFLVGYYLRPSADPGYKRHGKTGIYPR